MSNFSFLTIIRNTIDIETTGSIGRNIKKFIRLLLTLIISFLLIISLLRTSLILILILHRGILLLLNIRWLRGFRNRSLDWHGLLISILGLIGNIIRLILRLSRNIVLSRKISYRLIKGLRQILLRSSVILGRVRVKRLLDYLLSLGIV